MPLCRLYFKKHFHIEDSIEKMMADWNEMAAHKYQYEIPLKKGVREFLDFCKDKTLDKHEITCIIVEVSSLSA